MTTYNLRTRERKFAETKLRILDVFLKKLEKKELDEISVVEICEWAKISYKTFFNYFEKKSDLLAYYLQMWSIECQHFLADQWNISFEERLNKTFEAVAENYNKNFKIIKEIVSFLALNNNRINVEPLTMWEYIIRFPKKRGIEKFEFLTIEEILKPYYIEAKSKGEFKEDIDEVVFFSMIRSIFFWVFLSVKENNPELIKKIYQEQLKMVWIATKK